MNVEILATHEEEAEALSDLRVRSKGHWGYSRETLEAWRPAMVVTRRGFVAKFRLRERPGAGRPHLAA